VRETEQIQRTSYLSSLLLLQGRGFSAATVLDIGAAEGAFFLVRREAGLFPDARHFFVDPLQENEPMYRRLAAKFGAGYAITALSCMQGETVIRLDPNLYNTHIDRLQPDTAYRETRRVPLTTLDALVERHALAAPFAIKIDVQGAELDVLRGALATLEQASVVTVEIQIFFERDTIVELLSFMQGSGWALYDITDLAYYPSDQTFFQCYATFIPRHMDFRKGAPWCLPGQEKAIQESLRARRERMLRALEELVRQR
jgi:FkbM family methyltransferase